jgi:hypothetical protein
MASQPDIHVKLLPVIDKKRTQAIGWQKSSVAMRTRPFSHHTCMHVGMYVCMYARMYG